MNALSSCPTELNRFSQGNFQNDTPVLKQGLKLSKHWVKRRCHHSVTIYEVIPLKLRMEMHRQRQNYEMGKIQFLDDAIKTCLRLWSQPYLETYQPSKAKKKKNRFYICFSRDFTSFALEVSLINKTKSLKLYCREKKNEVFALSFYPRIEQDSISQLLRQ